MGSSVFDISSHSLQLLTTFENFWKWSECSVYLYGGKSWEVRSLLQSKTIPSDALGSYSSTRPCPGPWWYLSATMWVSLAAEPSRDWPSTPAHPPRVWDDGSPLCFSNLFAPLSSSLTPVSKSGRGHREASLSHALQSIAVTWEHTQLRAGERLFLTWVMGAAGRWAIPCAELVLLPCSSLLHSLTGPFSCVC